MTKELHVHDTVLYIPASKGGIPFRACHPKTIRKPGTSPHGELTVHKVTPEEMERLWK